MMACIGADERVDTGARIRARRCAGTTPNPFLKCVRAYRYCDVWKTLPCYDICLKLHWCSLVTAGFAGSRAWLPIYVLSSNSLRFWLAEN